MQNIWGRDPNNYLTFYGYFSVYAITIFYGTVQFLGTVAVDAASTFSILATFLGDIWCAAILKVNTVYHYTDTAVNLYTTATGAGASVGKVTLGHSSRDVIFNASSLKTTTNTITIDGASPEFKQTGTGEITMFNVSLANIHFGNPVYITELKGSEILCNTANISCSTALVNLCNAATGTITMFSCSTGLTIGKVGTSTCTFNNTTMAFPSCQTFTAHPSSAVSLFTTANLGALTIGSTTSTAALTLNSSDSIILSCSFVKNNKTLVGLFNDVVTTLNIGGAATTLNIGAASGTYTINNPALALPNLTSLNAGVGAFSLFTTTTGDITMGNIGGNLRLNSVGFILDNCQAINLKTSTNVSWCTTNNNTLSFGGSTSSFAFNGTTTNFLNCITFNGHATADITMFANGTGQLFIGGTGRSTVVLRAATVYIQGLTANFYTATRLTCDATLANIFTENTGSTNLLTGTTGTLVLGGNGTLQLGANTIVANNAIDCFFGATTVSTQMNYIEKTNTFTRRGGGITLPVPLSAGEASAYTECSIARCGIKLTEDTIANGSVTYVGGTTPGSNVTFTYSAFKIGAHVTLTIYALANFTTSGTVNGIAIPLPTSLKPSSACTDARGIYYSNAGTEVTSRWVMTASTLEFYNGVGSAWGAVNNNIYKFSITYTCSAVGLL